MKGSFQIGTSMRRLPLPLSEKTRLDPDVMRLSEALQIALRQGAPLDQKSSQCFRFSSVGGDGLYGVRKKPLQTCIDIGRIGVPGMLE